MTHSCSDEGDGVAAAVLDGISVVDLSNLMAGPMVSMYLGDFGADVVKVEDPHHADQLRQWGLRKEGEPLFFKVVNRNKRLVTIDLRDAAGQETARKLIAKADVLVESFRPGTLERWNLGYEELSRENPGLIMARISGYGQTGPYAERGGFGTVAEGFSGFAFSNGYPDRPPLLPSFGLADATSAVFGALGIMLALYRREQSEDKRGQIVDVGLYEPLLTLLGSHVIDFDQLGVVHERTGGALPFAAPRNVFESADERWIAISAATQRTFERLVEALDRDDLAVDPRFTTHDGRRAHRATLDAELQKTIGTMRSAEVLSRLEKLEAPVGPVYSIEELLADPHVASRGNIVAVEDPQLGTVRMQGVIPRLSETPGCVRDLPGGPGSDNASVLDGRDVAAVSDASAPKAATGS